MGTIPADLGDWSLARIFFEGGRLLTTQFGNMLPVILLFTFPASLSKVCRTQFFNVHQDSTYPEPVSIWIALIRNSLDLVSQALFLCGLCAASVVLRKKIYGDGDFQSFFAIMRSARTESNSDLLKYHRTVCVHGKFLKAFAAITLCVIVYITISTSGVNFTPEAVAEMGLPPWTVFVFTVLIAVIMALSTSYFHLTGLLVYVWAMVPQTPILV